MRRRKNINKYTRCTSYTLVHGGKPAISKKLLQVLATSSMIQTMAVSKEMSLDEPMTYRKDDNDDE